MFVRWFHWAVALFLLSACAPALRVGPVHAQQTPPGPQRFVGQVVRLFPSANNPAGFTLQLRNRTIDLTIGANTRFHAGSAEAEVEGFQVGDYAVVLARRFNHTWLASNIDFDVQPITVMQPQTVNGTILRISPSGKRFQLMLDAGPTRWVTATRKTRFHMNGQILDPPPPLLKGDIVQVVMERSGRFWIALDITIRMAGSPLNG